MSSQKQDFKNILENYELGGYKSHNLFWDKQNSVYRIITTKGKYILKVFGNSEFKFIEFQDKISRFLKSKIPTSVNILTKSNDFYFEYNSKTIIIQKFIEGTHPKRMTKNIILECSKYLGL